MPIKTIKNIKMKFSQSKYIYLNKAKSAHRFFSYTVNINVVHAKVVEQYM